MFAFFIALGTDIMLTARCKCAVARVTGLHLAEVMLPARRKRGMIRYYVNRACVMLSAGKQRVVLPVTQIVIAAGCQSVFLRIVAVVTDKVTAARSQNVTVCTEALGTDVVIAALRKNVVIRIEVVGAHIVPALKLCVVFAVTGIMPARKHRVFISLIALCTDVMIAARGKRMVFNIGIARIVTAVHKDVVFIQRIAFVMLSAVGKLMLGGVVAGVTNVMIPAGS